MFIQWLGKLFGGREVLNDNHHVDGSACRIREQFNNIAKSLYEHGDTAVHIHVKNGYTEFHTKKRGVIARVDVRGESGKPDHLVVECKFCPKEEELFAQHIPNLRIEFRTLME